VTMLRRTLLLTATCTAVAIPTVLEAQFLRRDQYGRVPRSHTMPFVGMLITGAASSLILQTKQRSMKGMCTTAECIAAVSLGSGAWVGWMIGKEQDALHALRYRGGRPLRAAATSLSLSGEPVALTVDRNIIATGGLGGVHVLQSEGGSFSLMAVRAPGLRGINDVAVASADDQLGIVAGGGFYRFPLREGQGVQLRAGGTATAVSVWEDAFLVATGSRVERVPRSADDAEPSWPGIELSDTVRAIKVSGRMAWAITNSALLAIERAGDSLRVVSTTALPNGARRFDLNGSTMAVALGDSGVVMLDIAQPNAPSIRERWMGARFAYDVALTESRLFVASGIDGVTVLGTTGSVLQTIGLARELGFIVNVSVQGDQLVVIDRAGTPIVRKVTVGIGG
jgi:hypothetical protein